MAQPFLKWVGGKRVLLPKLLEIIPETIDTYFEPMVGGGALFFELARLNRFKRAKLSDLNEELILTYRSIRDELPAVIEVLKSIEDKHMQALETHGSADKVFYKVRNTQPDNLPRHALAARMIYLNRTCFNGLYRVNHRGRFNAPYGHYKKPTICNVPVLAAASRTLQGVRLTIQDFEAATEEARKGDFVYFDPPYWPCKPESFTKYTSAGFDSEDQKRLAYVFEKLHLKGIRVAASNSDVLPIRELYKKRKIIEVSAPRRVNSNGAGRGNVSELVITNR